MDNTTQISVTQDAVAAAVKQYQEQHAQVRQQLEQLEQNYAQQRDLGLATLHQLQGAIQALEVLIPKPQEVPESIEVPTTE